MCHPSVLAFGARVLTAEHILAVRREHPYGRVLEIGARDVNGSLRGTVEALVPGVRYFGTDITPGPGVDRLIDITTWRMVDALVGLGMPEDLAARHATDDRWLTHCQWPMIICTEVLEHVRDWRAAVNNMKALLAPGGRILLTTRSLGFPFHEYPGDYWRFELWDLATIFRDFLIDVLEPDPEAPGVFLFATKPLGYGATHLRASSPADLSTLQMHSMQTGARAL